MKRFVLLSVVALSACDGEVVVPPPPPPPVDACEGLMPIVARAAPDVIRVNGAATVSATGGTGRYSYRITSEPAVGVLQGTRYVAGLVVGEDAITVTDDCGNSARVAIEVKASFTVRPVRSRVAPGTSLTISVEGAKGTVTYSKQGGTFASGGELAGATYTAGSTAPATDIILVKDDGTGDQAAVVVEVSAGAQFRPAAARLSLPTGSFVPLNTIDGSGVVSWSIVSGEGSLEQRLGALAYVAPTSPDAGGSDVVLEVHDAFVDAGAQVKVRLLTELTRPELVAQGRRSDVANMVSADFDGDGIEDVALGVPESDLNRPQGGAVFIFKGTNDGLPSQPTWTIPGSSDTAQFGSVMAAGDLDGDGKADLAISAPGDDVTIADSGAVYLYGIGPDGPRQLRAPLTGLGRGNFGAALAIGDVDGDGDNDLVVGSPGADLGGFTARGVIDIFVLQPGLPIPDLGEVRISGWDLDADGGTRRTSNLRGGRSLVVRDLNGDSRADLAILSSVNFLPNPADGGVLARNVIAAQVHLGRDAMKRFEDTPDLYVIPVNTGDGDEGTWKLDFIPAGNGRPALLMAGADRADSPNLVANDGGTSGGGNGGGVLLFDLSGIPASGAAPAQPRQITRLQAWSRVYGSQANIQAGRSFAAVDADGDSQPELVLGAPYASSVTDAGTLGSTGRLEFFSLSRLSAGAVVNRPDFSRGGSNRVDILGTAVTGWRGRVVGLNHRASTIHGDYTGRLDVFSAGNASPESWSVASIAIPNKPGGQSFGSCIEVGAQQGGLHAIVGVPSWSGAGADGTGGEIAAGRAIQWKAATPDVPTVIAEGANTAYQTDAGVRAFGGRGLAVDVAMTDFDDDGRQDLIVAAPAFSIPGRANDGGVNSTEYALNRAECAANGQTPGGVFVHLGRSDGTYKEGFRVWAVRDISGCTVPDGGAAAVCQRSALSRNGVIGRFDFDGDDKQDLAMTRSNGFEIFTGGRAPDDAQLNKPSMVCDPYFSFPFITQAVTVPTALGDLNNDGCDELAFRYADNNRQGIIVLYGFGSTCATNTASWVRVSGDVETGVAPMRLGIAIARASGVLADNRDAVAVTADLYPFQGDLQPTVLLLPVAQLNALKPASGERLVAVQGTTSLQPVPMVSTQRALNFGRQLAGGVDLDGDGRHDLVVSATGASLNGDGTGAVYVFKGGTVVQGPNQPALIIVADNRERASFGQDLSVSAGANGVPAAIGIGAPLSYRWGTSNGTAFVLPMNF
ncbi:MAG: FG-GAP-like repeat-containing protein [Archangium sp.]